MKRRTFLQSAATTTLAAPFILAQEAKGTNEQIGVGFIGTGERCHAHLDIVNGFKERSVARSVRFRKTIDRNELTPIQL